MPNVAGAKIKCLQCCTTQRAANCKREASIQLSVGRKNDENIWLTAFTDVIQELLQSETSGVSLFSQAVEIEDFMLDLTDLNIVYNSNKKVISKISFDSKNLPIKDD
eukprot:gene20772-22796_t